MKLVCVCLLVLLSFACASEREVLDTYKQIFQSLNEEQRDTVLAAVRSFQVEAKTCDEFFCNDPDCGKNVTQLIQSKGYPVEQHYALTSDGYWLSMQRIPHGRDQNSTSGRPVVLLQHGLLDASHTWVINFPHESLGFILADFGYDVWMGNNRGNTYSNTNEFYSYDDNDFWNFSWDEMASIDLPTQIDYALEYTGQSQLFYIGHSEGTTQAFAGFSNPAVAAKVKLFVALAPVASIAHMSSDFLETLAFLHVDTILEILGFNKFLVHSCWMNNLLDLVCTPDDGIFCQIGMCVAAGCDPKNMNATRYDVYMQLDPAGTSVQNMNHWGQMARTGDFCYYDFLTRHENEKHYGQAHPPCYDLSQMAAPVALFYGGKDKLGDPTDVQDLIAQLNPDVLMYSTEIDYYEHMDFVWGLDASTVLYPQIISLLKQYE